MAENVSDIVVAARPEGVEETNQQLDQMEQKVESSTDEMGDQADAMSGFASKWSGSMTAILGGLGLATTGLLSRVPVIGETMNRLEGILDGLAFQIDQALRPSLTGFNKDLAETESEIYNAETASGAFGKAMRGVNNAVDNATIAQVTNEIESLTGVEVPDEYLKPVIDAVTFDFVGSANRIGKAAGIISDSISDMDGLSVDTDNLFSGLQADAESAGEDIATGLSNKSEDVSSAASGLGKDISDGIDSKSDSISESASGIASNISDSITGLNADSWGENIIEDIQTGFRNKVESLGKSASALGVNIENSITDWDPGSWGENLIDDITTGFRNKVDSLGESASAIATNVTNSVTDWNPKEWGEQLIEDLIQGIKNKLSDLKSAGDTIAQAISDRLKGDSPPPKGPLSDIDEPGITETVAQGLTRNVGAVEGAANDVAESATNSSAGISERSREELAVFIDGRQANKGVARYRDSSVLRRGRSQ